MQIFNLKGHQPIIDPSAFIAPTAVIVGDVTIGKNASVWFNSVLRGDMNSIYIGDNSNIQDLTMCHVDNDYPLHVGNNVTVGHHCTIHGCTIEDDCLIGMGASILNGAKIGQGSIVAAGSLILENVEIPPFSLVTGLPGSVKRPFNGGVPELIVYAKDEYLEKVRYYTDPERFYRVVE